MQKLLGWTLLSLTLQSFTGLVAAAELPTLESPTTITGAPAAARFFAGATPDNGVTYKSTITATDSVDITARIQVASEHVGKRGDLYVVANINGQFYNQVVGGAFRPWNGNIGTLLPVIAGKVLDANENLTLVNDLVFGRAGFASGNLSVYLGYGLGAGVHSYSGKPLRIAIQPTPVPMPIEFFFGGAVTSQEESLIRNSAIRTEAFFRSQGLPSFSTPLSVHAYREYGELVSAFVAFSGWSVSAANEMWSRGMGGVAFNQSFWLNLNSESWLVVQEWQRASIIAHELFHNLQYQLRGSASLSDTPTWLVEGSAHYAAYLMTGWAGLREFEIELRQIRERESTNKPSLAALEIYSGFNSTKNPYQIVLLAAELLTNDLSDFATFYSAIGKGTSWKDAFIQAFGRTVEAFYKEFEAYQSKGYQP